MKRLLRHRKGFYVIYLALFLFTQISHAQEIQLSPVWVRIGDSFGEEDMDNGTASVEAAEFSPDGTLIASGSKRGWEVRLWDVETGALRWERKHEEEVEVVAFSRDGQFVASGGEDLQVRIWTVGSGDSVATLAHLGSIDGMRFSHDGSILATGDESGMVTIWRVADWVKLHEIPQGPDELRGDPAGVHADVNSIDFTLDDQYVAVASRNLKVRIWRVEPDKGLTLVRELEGHAGSIKSTRISPDARFVAAGANDSGVKVWDFETGELVASLPAFARIMEAVEFTPDGKYLLVGGNENEDTDDIGAIRVYRVPQTDQDAFELVAEESVFRQEYFHFNADGSRLVSSHEDGTLRLWAVSSRELPPPVFSNIEAGSGRIYTPWILQTNQSFYSDRPIKITSLPPYLDFVWGIRTANNDSAVRDTSFLKFNLNTASAVYVAYDARASVLPAWLQGWEAISEAIGIEDFGVDRLNVYRKVFPAGEVVLGGNLAPPAAGALQNYIVAAVSENSTGTFAPPSAARGAEIVLKGNYPNPFTVGTAIVFEINLAGEAHLEVFDTIGRPIESTRRTAVHAGQRQQVVLDTASWPAGLYFYRVQLRSGSTVYSQNGKLLHLN